MGAEVLEGLGVEGGDFFGGVGHEGFIGFLDAESKEVVDGGLRRHDGSWQV